MSYSTPNNTSRIDRPAAIKSSSLLTLPTEKVLVKDISSTTIRTSSLSDFTKQIPLDNKKTPLIKSIWNSLLGRRREDEDPPVRLLRTSASASKLQDAKVSSTRGIKL